MAHRLWQNQITLLRAHFETKEESEVCIPCFGVGLTLGPFPTSQRASGTSGLCSLPVLRAVQLIEKQKQGLRFVFVFGLPWNSLRCSLTL